MKEKMLIYGGTGGIGSATARLLYERGYELHLVARNEDSLKTVADKTGAGYTAGDIKDPDTFARAVSAAGDRIDGLVYAVGTINLKSLQRLKEDDFIEDFRINALGAALAVQTALPALRKSERIPSVVLYSSVAVTQGFSFHASVGMAKGAVAGLALSLAAELAPRIRVNAIAPSLTRTGLAGKILANEKMAASLAALHPLQRLGRPEDIAAMTAFLLSKDSEWITGQIIGVDGGRSTLRYKS